MWSGDTAPPIITPELEGGQCSSSALPLEKGPHTHWIGGPLITIIQSFTANGLKMITEKHIPLRASLRVSVYGEWKGRVPTLRMADTNFPCPYALHQ
jgi:hypothetical protein